MLQFRVNYKPTPLKRPRLTRIGGKPVIYDASKKEKKAWLQLARQYAPKTPLTNALTINLEFCFPRPKNHYGTGRNKNKLKPSAPLIHTFMPDVDNLSKFILDAMNEVFYNDDRQVVELNSHKEYINDATNTTGYTIVTVLPYKVKGSHFDTSNEENTVQSAKDSKNNINNYGGMFPVNDSSSESISESTTSENIK